MSSCVPIDPTVASSCFFSLDRTVPALIHHFSQDYVYRLEELRLFYRKEQEFDSCVESMVQLACELDWPACVDSDSLRLPDLSVQRWNDITRIAQCSPNVQQDVQRFVSSVNYTAGGTATPVVPLNDCDQGSVEAASVCASSSQSAPRWASLLVVPKVLYTFDVLMDRFLTVSRGARMDDVLDPSTCRADALQVFCDMQLPTCIGAETLEVSVEYEDCVASAECVAEGFEGVVHEALFSCALLVPPRESFTQDSAVLYGVAFGTLALVFLVILGCFKYCSWLSEHKPKYRGGSDDVQALEDVSLGSSASSTGNSSQRPTSGSHLLGGEPVSFRRELNSLVIVKLRRRAGEEDRESRCLEVLSDTQKADAWTGVRVALSEAGVDSRTVHYEQEDLPDGHVVFRFPVPTNRLAKVEANLTKLQDIYDAEAALAGDVHVKSTPRGQRVQRHESTLSAVRRSRDSLASSRSSSPEPELVKGAARASASAVRARSPLVNSTGSAITVSRSGKGKRRPKKKMSAPGGGGGGGTDVLVSDSDDRLTQSS